MHQTSLKKLIYRPRAGTPRAKQLEEFKQEEDLKAATKFIERNIGKCHKTVVEKYFLKDHPMTFT